MKKILETKTCLMLLVMLVLLLNPVQAALIVNKVTDEFSLESPYPQVNVKACQCSTRTDILEVKNIGDFEALFKVEVYSPIRDLITLSDDTFELVPGEDNKVYVYINIPCDKPLNTYYVVKVRTNYGRSKEIFKEIVSGKCQNIKFTSKVVNDVILPGNIVVIQVDLQNVGDFTDTFRITPEAHLEYTALSEEEVSLAPDQQATIYIYVKFPLSRYGKIDYPFMVSSEKGNNHERGFESFIIERDYDFAITTEEFKINACEEVTKKAVLTFTNLAQTPNKYYLRLTAPEFVQLSQDQLDLEGGEEDSVVLLISPTQEQIGEYDISLSVSTEYGDMYKEKNFKLRVNDCFDSKVTLEGWEGQITDKDCCGEKYYTLNIRNDGLYEEAYEIITDSPGWIRVMEENRFVRLRPSQNVNIPVIANFPCVDAQQTSYIIVKQQRPPYQTHEIRVDLESLSQRSCYNVDLLHDKYRINYDTASIPMLLQNTGLRGGTYKLELGELESRFVYLDEETMEFEPGETKVVHVYPMDYADYKQGTYLNRLSLTISLVQEEEELDINYHRQFWIVLKDKNFIVKAIDYISNFNYSRIGLCGLVTLIIAGLACIMLIIVLVLRFKPNLKIRRIKASKIRVIKIVNIILIFLLIISILAIILIGNPDTTRFYEEPAPLENKTALLHEWRMNTPYQINLDQYFTDPDLDVLSYTASQPYHIHVSIEGNMATLRPEHNWAGTERIVFTANDNKGGVTDSPIMTLRVLNKRPVGILGYWNAYCTHINIVLLIVLILLVLLFFDIIEEKGYHYYRPKTRPRRRKKKR
ncbi:hypothetical protein AYK26_01555 [Euryarchaeota archaeon SM23-78]|nr:MAG: hypothetical protein AYK26_01555 [Euryarchaeota archaeon SM23-78]MBW3000447.1 hypothetical protein [Candidatus Woesearchaeota archaeon]